jgi:hypothetical protein
MPLNCPFFSTPVSIGELSARPEEGFLAVHDIDAVASEEVRNQVVLSLALQECEEAGIPAFGAKLASGKADAHRRRVFLVHGLIDSSRYPAIAFG